MPEFSQLSKSRLETCHGDLQRLFNAVIEKADCSIICGFRNEEDQNKAFHDGFSKLQWPHGEHNHFPSTAVDVCPCPIDWEDVSRFEAFAEVVKATADELGIKVEWGGSWAGWKDYPHWQIPKQKENV